MPINFWEESDSVSMTGGEAAAEAMRQIGPRVVPVFPITPQTPIIEKFASYVANGKVDSEIIPAESEHSVMSAAVGAAASGSRVMTATSSVGLALMYEILGVASGMRMPIVMNVANRSISSPINIHCDHSDTMGVRDSGWLQIFSETAQEVYDHNFLAVRLAEAKDVLLPVMVMQDGFITSHMLDRLEIVSDEKIKNFVGEYQYPYSLFDEKNHFSFGALMLPDKFFETKCQQNEAVENARKEYKKLSKELEKITGREYPEVETYKVNKDTEAVIVVMSSAAGTAKEVADKLNKDGHKVGVVKIRLFRPFPYEELAEALKNIENIAVLDRTFSFGSVPPLHAEVCQTLFRLGKSKKQNIQSYIFGLGGRDLREKDVEEVYADILGGKYSLETKFLNVEK